MSEDATTPARPINNDMKAPAGFVTSRKIQGKTATTHPVGRPKRSPASRQKTPEGSYFKKGAAGKIGTSMKLVAMDSATKKAEVAICLVFHFPLSVE